MALINTEQTDDLAIARLFCVCLTIATVKLAIQVAYTVVCRVLLSLTPGTRSDQSIATVALLARVKERVAARLVRLAITVAAVASDDIAVIACLTGARIDDTVATAISDAYALVGGTGEPDRATQAVSAYGALGLDASAQRDRAS